MIFAFMVSWTVSIWVSDPCPDFKPDRYTGQYPQINCLAIHGHFESIQKSEMFKSREDAETFINNAPPGMSKETFKIQEIKIETSR